jgi:hypothetical protein
LGLAFDLAQAWNGVRRPGYGGESGRVVDAVADLDPTILVTESEHIGVAQAGSETERESGKDKCRSHLDLAPECESIGYGMAR